MTSHRRSGPVKRKKNHKLNFPQKRKVRKDCGNKFTFMFYKCNMYIFLNFKCGYTYTAHLHIPFTHAFLAMLQVFPVLTLVETTKVITMKPQCNAEIACVNRMWQLGFMHTFSVLNCNDKHEFQMVLCDDNFESCTTTFSLVFTAVVINRGAAAYQVAVGQFQGCNLLLILLNFGPIFAFRGATKY